MTNKKTHDRWSKKQELKRCGIESKPRQGVLAHNSKETYRHFLTKAAIAYLLNQKGVPWTTETKIENKGRVDVLNWGEPEEEPIAIEAESGLSDKRHREKAKQYCENTPIADVLAVDPQELPNDLEDLKAELERELNL